MHSISVIIPTWNEERGAKALKDILSKSINARGVLIVSGETTTLTANGKIDGSVVYYCQKERLGVLEGFIKGIALSHDAEFYAFLHDDTEILEEGWDQKVIEMFDRPVTGLVGFGGSKGFGDIDIYRTHYHFSQLKRHYFLSNMRDWQIHGYRTLQPERVAALDGFSMIFRKTAYESMGGWGAAIRSGLPGYILYDAWACCMMRRLKWEVWVCPIYCHHRGGETSTSAEYAEWVKQQGFVDGQELYHKSHRLLYNLFKDVIPMRVP